MAVPAVTNNSPVAGSIAWAAFTIQYNGVGYAISAGSTAQKWVWWRYNAGSSVIEAGANVPSDLTDDDLVLFGNKAGIAVRIQSTSFVDGELLVDGSIVAEALAANSVTTKALAAEAVTVDKLAAKSVSTDKLAALVGILGTLLVGDGSGRTITIDPINGINVVDQYGTSVFQVPTSVLSDINMTADVVARSLTALGVVAFRNPINELAPGAGLYIRKGTTAPRTPLVVTMSNPKVLAPRLDLQSVAGNGAYFNNLYYTAINSDPAQSLGTVTNGAAIVSFAHRTTGLATFVKDVPNFNPSTDYGGQLFRIKTAAQGAGLPAWGFGYYRQGGTDTFRIRLLDESFNNLPTPKDFQVSEITQTYINEYRSIFFSVKSDESALEMWVSPPSGMAGSILCWTYNWSATTPSGVGNGTIAGIPAGSYVQSVIGGKYDFGGVNHRIIVVLENGFRVYDNTSSHTRVTAEEFPVAVGSDFMASLFWDSTNGQFYSYDYNRYFFQHSKYAWTDVPHDTLRVSSAWETTAPAGATTEGPITQFTAKKRQYINVTIPGLPTGVTQARVFFGYGSPDGGRTSHFSNGAFTGTTAQFEIPLFTGTNPAAVSTIADSSPAFFQVDALDGSGQPTVKISGDGSGRMGPYAWDAAGKDFSPFCSVSSTTVSAISTGVFTRQSTLAPDANGGDPVAMWVVAENAIAIPKSGWYRVAGNAQFESATSGTGATSLNRRIMAIDTYPAGAAPAFNVAGAQIVRVENSAHPSQTYYPSFAASKAVYLAAGTRVRLTLYQNSGANLNTRFDVPMSMSVEWIRA